MNLKGKRLDEWFLSLEGSQSLICFPHSENYFTKYKGISEQLYQWVHPEVGVGSTASNPSDGPIMVLTNHGNDHIHTLIVRVTQFLEDNDYCELSPFEIYVLLLSIHIHDVGNILGRKDHEKNSQKIIERIGTGVVGQDNLVWDYIFEIAKAHKDFQIDYLAEKDYLHEKLIRPQLLAAILKFADELAENFSRASNINMKLDNVPKESLLFHTIASTINSIIPLPKSREIKMIFNINEDDLKKIFLKKGIEIYLIEEIYLRTLKAHSERVYCMKFMRPYINFENIKVTLNIKLNDGQRVQRWYILEERIVEDIENIEEVYKVCPKLIGQSGKEIHNLIINKDFKTE